MEINRGNQVVDTYGKTGHVQEKDIINALYRRIAPDVNFLIKMLSSAAYDVVLCPENGKWRCAACLSLRGGQVAIFFPYIPMDADESEGMSQESIAIGVRGNVTREDIWQMCQNVIAIFEQNIPCGALIA